MCAKIQRQTVDLIPSVVRESHCEYVYNIKNSLKSDLGVSANYLADIYNLISVPPEWPAGFNSR